MKIFLLKCTVFIVFLLLVVVGIRTFIVSQKQNKERYKLDDSFEKRKQMSEDLKDKIGFRFKN